MLGFKPGALTPEPQFKAGVPRLLLQERSELGQALQAPVFTIKTLEMAAVPKLISQSGNLTLRVSSARLLVPQEIGQEMGGHGREEFARRVRPSHPITRAGAATAPPPWPPLSPRSCCSAPF